MFSRPFGLWNDYDPFISSPLDDFFFAPVALRQLEEEGTDDLEKMEGRQSQQQGKQVHSLTQGNKQQQQQQLIPQQHQQQLQQQRQQSMIPRINMDLVAENDRYIVKAELPGMNKENVNLSLNNGLLSISGNKKDEHSHEETKQGVHYIRKERSMGSFSRSIRLPRDALEENIDARFTHGLLTISIPRNPQKQKEMKGRIEIKDEANPSSKI